MKKVLFKLLTMSLLSILVFSCKEEEIVPSNEELLMAKTWRIEVLEIKTSGITVDVVKLLADYIAAEPVIEIKFEAENLYEITDKNSLLSLSGLGTQASGKWELEGADNKTLVLDKGTETETKLTIQNLSSTDFVSKTSVVLDSSILNSLPSEFQLPASFDENSELEVMLDFRPL